MSTSPKNIVDVEEMYTNSGDKIVKRYSKAVITYARMNPPTIGHKELIKNLVNEASNNADVYVFLTSTEDNKRNPLTIKEKIFLLKKILDTDSVDTDSVFKNVRIINTTTCGKNPAKPCKGIFDVKNVLQKEYKYDEIILGLGSDRFNEKAFDSIVNTKTSRKSFGKSRNDASANLVQSISGTKLREAALKEDLNSLRQGTGIYNDDTYLLYLIKRIKYELGKPFKKQKPITATVIPTKKAKVNAKVNAIRLNQKHKTARAKAKATGKLSKAIPR